MPLSEHELQSRGRALVEREVVCCMSSIVAELARFYPYEDGLIEQAFELASPIPDYEEAAREAGWQNDDNGDVVRTADPDECHVEHTWQAACELDDIEPHEREIFGHWAVTDWLADKLIKRGAKVDKDFGGLCIWARTTTGQALYADGVIEAIVRDLAQERAATCAL